MAVRYRAAVIDLVLRGGLVCDGSGAPASIADVAVDAGRIAAVGPIHEPARRTIDAAGLIVAPGFVDVHTHYDAQVTWDRLCTPSCWHGVTSVVVGNCGFGIAPCRPADRDRLLHMLEHVEGMPFESLRAGVAWEWETFPEYLAALGARPLGLNVAALVPHSAIRTWVLGHDAYARIASDAETEAMCTLVRQAMAAGAIGLATSRSNAHVGEGGRPVPSRLASREELYALARAMAERGRGVLEITPATFPLDADEGAFLQRIAADTGRPVSFSAILSVPDRPDIWDDVFARMRVAEGRLFPQVSCRPMRFDFDLVTGCASLDAAPAWRRWRETSDPAAHRALLRDVAFREAVRRDTIGRTEAPSSRRWGDVVVEDTTDRRWLGQTLGAVGAARGTDPIEAMLDLALADDLATRFSMLLLNYDEDEVGVLLSQPETLVALSDAGAHVSVLCDAGYATHFLGHWVRERSLCDWPEAVRRLTAMPAAVYGLEGRGRLVPGAVADVTCFDPTRVGSRPPERVADFPAGAVRQVVRADGIVHVLVGGEPLVSDGAMTGALPGRVLVGGATR